MGQHRLFNWHRWFAWHPVRTIDERWAWLRPVWRQPVHFNHDKGDGFFWEHARLDGYGFETDTPAGIRRG